jgi:hypothetical protein
VIQTQNVLTGAVQPSLPVALSAEAALPPGSVTADAVGQVQESLENNNRICKSLFVPSLQFTPGTLP